jgi:predicted class III extradiol MEMO1 family dioxygenase
LIVPHAGHIYSGPIAARAYALLVPLHAAISRVVMLGPAHRVAVRGLALPDALAFATPLGRIPLDQDAMRRAQVLPQVCVRSTAHANEHSLEVARRRGLRPSFLDLRNSGDTASDRSRVVGYAALAFAAPLRGDMNRG